MGTVNLEKRTVNLQKKEKVNLTKSTNNTLHKVDIGLGWDPVQRQPQNIVHATTGQNSRGFLNKLFGARTVTEAPRPVANTIDCDAWVYVDKGDREVSGNDCCYFGHKEVSTQNGKILKHHGDNLTGEGDGDDEVVTLNFKNITNNIDRLIVGVTIFGSEMKNQTFSDIDNTFIRVVNTEDNNFEICRYTQSDIEGSSNQPCRTFIAGEFIRNKDNEWEFVAVGRGLSQGNMIGALKQYLNRN